MRERGTEPRQRREPPASSYKCSLLISSDSNEALVEARRCVPSGIGFASFIACHLKENLRIIELTISFFVPNLEAKNTLHLHCISNLSFSKKVSYATKLRTVKAVKAVDF